MLIKHLQSFAIGAALFSTSLGTIFAVLDSLKGAHPSLPNASSTDNDKRKRTPDLLQTRLGTILVGAALLDDIVALVISSVVSALGESLSTGSGSTESTLNIQPWQAARPIVSSVLLLVITAALARFVCRPFARALGARLGNGSSLSKRPPLQPDVAGLVAVVALVVTLCAFVTVANYIRSSMLVGAFCAGTFANYVYRQAVIGPEEAQAQLQQAAEESNDRITAKPPAWFLSLDPKYAFTHVEPIKDLLLVPFFFASIGAAIPVKDLFTGKTVWRGAVVYTALMFVGKLAAGAVLLLADVASRFSKAGSARRRERKEGNAEVEATDEDRASKLSLAPSLFLGLSLVARGEIGFFILSIAAEGGIIGAKAEDKQVGFEAYNVAVWAIVLNTFLGPLLVGILLRFTRLGERIACSRWN